MSKPKQLRLIIKRAPMYFRLVAFVQELVFITHNFASRFNLDEEPPRMNFIKMVKTFLDENSPRLSAHQNRPIFDTDIIYDERIWPSDLADQGYYGKLLDIRIKMPMTTETYSLRIDLKTTDQERVVYLMGDTTTVEGKTPFTGEPINVFHAIFKSTM